MQIFICFDLSVTSKILHNYQTAQSHRQFTSDLKAKRLLRSKHATIAQRQRRSGRRSPQFGSQVRRRAILYSCVSCV